MAKRTEGMNRMLYSVAETADMMGPKQTPKTIYARLKRNPRSLPPTVRIGWRLYFLDVPQWLRKRADDGNPPAMNRGG